jgi:hypothetical protein
MSRIVMYLGKDTSGNYYDPLTGNRLACVTDSNVQGLVDEFKVMRASQGILRTKKAEIELKSIHLLANHTAGGELKAPFKFKK